MAKDGCQYGAINMHFVIISADYGCLETKINRYFTFRPDGTAHTYSYYGTKPVDGSEQVMSHSEAEQLCNWLLQGEYKLVMDTRDFDTTEDAYYDNLAAEVHRVPF